MHDIRLIRDDPAAFDAALARRGVSVSVSNLMSMDHDRRRFIKKKEEWEAERKKKSAFYGQLRGQGQGQTEEAQQFQKDAIAAGNYAQEFEVLVAEANQRVHDFLSKIPNLPLADVPQGAGEDENVVEKTVGDPTAFGFDAQEHDAIGPAIGLDFETGVKLSGARFTLVRGAAAKLHRALGQFMLDTLTGIHGYEEVVPPVLVRGDALYGTGQLPKFAEDLFKTTGDHWLIPTAEVSLTNIVAGEILAERELPLRFTALTMCFRSEAGAAGRDTRGFIRQHQFEKAEMVSITTPDQSDAEHERMTQAAEDILNRLVLPFRRMKLCTGDMGFSAARTYDLEVWLPGQQRYREISSCSTCTDFQARRMNARYRPEGEKATRFVHTLNGSGLAVGRTLVAVLENYQQADGSVVVPDVLRRYVGQDVLTPAG